MKHVYALSLKTNRCYYFGVPYDNVFFIGRNQHVRDSRWRENMYVLKRLFIFVNRFSWLFFNYFFIFLNYFDVLILKFIFKNKNIIFIYFKIKKYFIKQEYHIPKIYLESVWERGSTRVPKKFEIFFVVKI